MIITLWSLGSSKAERHESNAIVQQVRVWFYVNNDMNAKVFEGKVYQYLQLIQNFFKLRWSDAWIKGQIFNKANTAKYFRI